MNTSERFTWRQIGKQVRVALALIVFALLLLGIFSSFSAARPAFTSSEVKFADTSAHGLSIVPASCPSPPFTELFVGECGTKTPLCPNGTPAPHGNLSECPGGPPTTGGCPVGYTLQNAQCVFAGCPAWYSLQGTSCVLLGCPAGYVLQSGQCVLNSCPSNYVLQNGDCVQLSCPSGQSAQDGVCVSYGQCVAKNECIGQNLYARQTSCKATLVETCPYGCAVSACIIPPPSIAIWDVSPLLVREGSTVQVAWAAQNVTSCAITGTNGDSWTGTSGTKTSSPITVQTIYAIVCQGLAGSSPPTITDTTTVNIVPVFHEN